VDRSTFDTTSGRLTLHVRLVDGKETEHVVEAIFKALGAALRRAMPMN